MKEHIYIFSAITKGKRDIAIQLLEKEQNIEIRNKLYLTPLHYAARTNSKQLAEYLIGRGADVDNVDNRGYTPLHWAAIHGHIPITRFLISHGANLNAESSYGELPFHLAAWYGHLELVKFFIARGVNVNRITKKGKTALQGAKKFNHDDVVELLKTHGAIEKEWMTVPEWQVALKNNEIDEIKFLSSNQIKGMTPKVLDLTFYQFMEESRYCYTKTEALKYLLDLGGDTKYLPLCPSSSYAHEFIIRGADINRILERKDIKWMNPGYYISHLGGNLLHNAVDSRKNDLIEYVLENNADISIKNIWGKTPLELIVENTDDDYVIKNIRFSMFAPYVINQQKEEDFLFLLKHDYNFIKFDFSKLTLQACKNCLLWINQLLTTDTKPKWFFDSHKITLQILAGKLIQQLYPDLIKQDTDLVQLKNIILLLKVVLYHQINDLTTDDLKSYLALYDTGSLNEIKRNQTALLEESVELHRIRQNYTGGFDQRQLLGTLTYIFKSSKNLRAESARIGWRKCNNRFGRITEKKI